MKPNSVRIRSLGFCSSLDVIWTHTNDAPQHQSLSIMSSALFVWSFLLLLLFRLEYLVIPDYLAWYCDVRIILLYLFIAICCTDRERKKPFIAGDSLQRIFPHFVFVCCTLTMLVALSIPEAPIDVHLVALSIPEEPIEVHSSGGAVLCIHPASSVDSTFKGKDQNELQNYCYIEYKTSWDGIEIALGI